ncbi:putative nucleic acid-binding Zn-ribbon protein [Desulfitispora alkaliphila]|uniref:DUF6115 domain-containing protein n=1 Tax=Desulfitispora alkaliphila TaxID=622674 RepID=UPI003D1C1070
MEVLLLMLGITIVALVIFYDYKVEEKIKQERESLDKLLFESTMVRKELVGLLNQINVASSNLVNTRLAVESYENEEQNLKDDFSPAKEKAEKPVETIEAVETVETIKEVVAQKYRSGYSIEQISKELNLGKGEVELYIKFWQKERNIQ